MPIISRKTKPIELKDESIPYIEIAKLLKKTIGLDPDSIGSSSLNSIIRLCANESGYKDIYDYHDELVRSECELIKLIEAVVVSETWFFRDSNPFKVFEKYVRENWFHNSVPKYETLRVLSSPCSTGEEPYSIAIILNEMQYPSTQFQIDAIDLSSQSIKYARRAIYRKNSFRGDDISFRGRFFSEENSSYRLNEEICDLVNFYQGNVLEQDSFPAVGPYHVIFCRNLLIYFDRSDQECVVNFLYKLLAPGGMLFVGHAEMNSIFDNRFTPISSRGAFGYVKIDSKNPSRPKKISKVQKKYGIKTKKNITNSSTLAVKKKTLEEKPCSEIIVTKIINYSADDETLLSTIKKLADEGKLRDASILCEKYLSNYDDCAEVYYLLGVISEAEGKNKCAVELYQKAVYLDPNCHEALIHLALCADRQGDTGAANRYKRRAARITARLKQ